MRARTQLRSAGLFLSATVATALAAGAGPAMAQTFGPPDLFSNSVPLSDSEGDASVRLATDGAGNWVAVWNSNDPLDGSVGSDFDIFVAHSTDDGATWTVPEPLNTNATTDSGHDFSPDIATDNAGGWVAVWQTADSLGGTIGVEGDILVAHSTDNGATWTTAAPLNSNAATDSGFDSAPRITADGLGNWVAVWGTGDSLGGTIGTDGDILVASSVDIGATWSAPSALNTNASIDSGLDFLPQVATDGLGNWVAVWTSSDSLGGTIGTDYDVLVARSTDDGATWTAPSALNSSAGVDTTKADQRPHVTTDKLGNWVAVWDSQSPDNDILVAGSTDNGATWTAQAALNSNAGIDSGNDFLPHLATDGVGNWVAVWHSFDNLAGTIGTDDDILTARSTDNGASWSPVAALNTNAATDGSAVDTAPHVATDGFRWLVVWDSDNGFDSTIGLDYDILGALSTDAGATWTAPALVNINGVSDTTGDDAPQLTTDGAGNWIAVWGSADSLGETTGIDYDIVIRRSTDAGQTWTALSALNTNATVDSLYDTDFQPQITTDGAGNWVAVWSGTGLSSDFDILVARSTDNGATWTAPATLNTNAAFDFGNDFKPQVSTDGSGNWVAVWHTNDDLGGTIGYDNDLLVATSTDNGATWSAPETLNTNAAVDSGGDEDPQVTTDGAGNWVVVWWSNDDLGGTIGTDYDVLIARSTDAGATWTAPVAFNTDAALDSAYDYTPQVTYDGAGNWLAIWTAYGIFGLDYDIVFAHSTDDGVTWTAPAAVDANAAVDADHEFEPEVTTDGAGNWVAVWSSPNDLGGTIGTDSDVLFARSTNNGATWTVPAALNGNATTDYGQDYSSQVTTDGAGNWIALWSSGDTLGGLASFGRPDVFMALGSICGDSNLAGSEQCDEGDLLAGDCCSPSCSFESAGDPCPADGEVCTADVCDGMGSCGVEEPLDDAFCLVAPNTKLQITNSDDPTKDKLAWQWSKGDSFDQLDLGSPLTTTDYTLCVYDTTSTVPSLATSLEVPASGTFWTSKDPKGFIYKDTAGTADGVTKLQLKTGEATKTKVKLQAKGTGLTLPVPAGAVFFNQTPKVVAQLRSSTGECWTSEFTSADTSKNEAAAFKALTK